MTCTIWAPCADEVGASRHDHYWADQRGRACHGVELSRQRTSDFETRQPGHIGIDLDHDGDELGCVVHLERGDFWLHAVAVVDADADDHERLGPLYWSTTTTGRRDHRSNQDTAMTITSIAITKHPAGVALPALKVLPGDLRSYDDRNRWSTKQTRGIVQRAVDRIARPRPSDVMTILDTRPRRPRPGIRHVAGDLYIDSEGRPVPVMHRTTAPMASDRPPVGAGPVEIRPCGPILSVR